MGLICSKNEKGKNKKKAVVHATTGGIVDLPGRHDNGNNGGAGNAGNGHIVDVFEAKRAKLNPADYKFVDKHRETLVKLPNSIKGQSFDITKCVDCDIFILDHTAQVTIDECKNCRIFIGPTEGAVFFRTCYGCKFVLICQQLRTRDCRDIDLLLFCGTKPTIEATSQIRFGCLQFAYFGLAEQLKAAGLNEWNNPWSNVYDFTKDGSRHHDYLDKDTKISELLLLDKLYENSDITAEELHCPSVFPMTAGISRKMSGKPVFIVALASKAHMLLTTIRDAARSERKSEWWGEGNHNSVDLSVSRTSQLKLTKEHTKKIIQKQHCFS